MKCVYIYFMTVTVISAAVPQDLCDTCVPTQDCPLFENLNVTDQLIWMEKFPCGSLPKNKDYEVPAGFASAAKGDYVCCSNNIWGVEKPEHYERWIGHESSLQPQIPLDNDDYNPSHGLDNNFNNKNHKYNNDFSYDNRNTINKPNNEEFNNNYYNKYNQTRRPLNKNSPHSNNVHPSTHNLDDYNANHNDYDSNQSSPNNGSTVWFPDRSRNYDNTDYWKTHNPENNEERYWNDRPGRKQNIENTQRPPNVVRLPDQYPPGSEANGPGRNNQPTNIVIPPNQHDPPMDEARPSNQLNLPGNDARPPIGNNPPGNVVRPPIQYDPPVIMDRPPSQNNPLWNDARPPSQNYRPGNVAGQPNQFNPPGNGVRPPGQNYPPANVAGQPSRFNPPGNGVRPGDLNYPPTNVAGQPNRFNPPGNGVRPGDLNYTPANVAGQPNRFNPPGHGVRPGDLNYPPANVAGQPNRFTPPGNGLRPGDLNYPPANVAGQPNRFNRPGNGVRPGDLNYPLANVAGQPNRFNPPENGVRPGDLNYPPANVAGQPNRFKPPGNGLRPGDLNYPPANVAGQPNRFNPPGNEVRPGDQNYPPGNAVGQPNQYDRPVIDVTPPDQKNPPENIVRPPIQYDPPGNMARPPNNYYYPGNMALPPNQNIPPGYDMARPPQHYGPEGRFRPPNYYSPGISKPPNQYFPPSNMGRPHTYYPPASNNFMPGPPYTNNPWEPDYNYYDQRNRRNGNNYDFNNNYPYYSEHPHNFFNQNNNLGNYGSGQCSLTSFPPDPQSDCCGRQLADDDRITGPNNKPAFTNHRPLPSYPSGPIWRTRRSISENDGNVTIENRISGGHATELYQYPWTVLLLTTFDYGRHEAAFNCGGGLLSAKYVLTAGHCVYDKDASVKSVQVNLAEYDKNTFPRDCKSTRNGRKCIENVVMYAEEVITHPQYENENLVNDIALLRLRGSAPYTEYIRPICLPSINIDEPQYSNLQFDVAGWGRVGPYSSNIKQSTVLHLVNHNECRRYYPQLTNKHLCASGKRGADTCKGDSGGPLMVPYRGKYYVAGIVSGKRADSPCGTEVPSLYTNVYHYVDWIRNNIRN